MSLQSQLRKSDIELDFFAELRLFSYFQMWEEIGLLSFTVFDKNTVMDLIICAIEQCAIALSQLGLPPKKI